MATILKAVIPAQAGIHTKPNALDTVIPAHAGIPRTLATDLKAVIPGLGAPLGGIPRTKSTTLKAVIPGLGAPLGGIPGTFEELA